MSTQGNESTKPRTFRLTGYVRFVDSIPAAGLRVIAYDRDLRGQQRLDTAHTDRTGFYSIEYSEEQFLNKERGTADLVVKAFDERGRELSSSNVHFNSPDEAVIDLTIPLEVMAPASLFERIEAALKPLLGALKIRDLEEDQTNQDLTFLCGETSFAKRDIARFVLAHHLEQRGLDREFWFALLGGSIFQYSETSSLKTNLQVLRVALPSLDAPAVRRALERSFTQREIPSRFEKKIERWIKAFLALIDQLALGDAKAPTFAKQALEHAGIRGAAKQAKFARLINEYKRLTPELIEALDFTRSEIADLRTSYALEELTRADFSIVKALKDEFEIRTPEQVRALAKHTERDWIAFIDRHEQSGKVVLPLHFDNAGDVEAPKTTAYAKFLERRFKDSFPSTAFAGDLQRSIGSGHVTGIKHATELQRIVDSSNFDLLRTPIDEYLDGAGRRLGAFAKDLSFRSELKAVQRVFKLAPTFEAADALLSDGLHSAQMVYRLGQSEFVRRYGGRAGFTPEAARAAWNRAADTHAAALTIIGDLASFDSGVLPGVLKSSHPDLSKFPNWNNLFQTGDICHCEHCRSALSPAAFYTDMLMNLRDRSSIKINPNGGFYSARDILFMRRPDLGYLELNCENALTTLPYVDVVCEVLENAVDKDGAQDIELIGFATVPSPAAAAHAAVESALKTANIVVGSFTLSQVDPADVDRWVVHGDEATYLLVKKATANFFARVLPNTKAPTEELRAYPAYVNAKAYEKLRGANFPLSISLDLFPDGDTRRREQRSRAFSLPFDLFAEEVRGGFRKINVQRSEIMRAFKGPSAPNNATDGQIAAEYFGISCDPAGPFDEYRLILNADTSVAGQQALWGETGNGAWLNAVADAENSVANVKTFLRKTGLEYRELLALLDLPFINSVGDILIEHLDASCDTAKKVIKGLPATKLDRLDRIHRFLRLWRKLPDWRLWELDLAIRCAGVGNGSLDEQFLVNLFHLAQLKRRLGAKASIEQLCGLFENISTETHFTDAHQKRSDGLYQSLFLNRKLVQPLDPAFAVAAVAVNGPTAEKISGHRSAIVAALGVREVDLDTLARLTRTDGSPYIDDDLTLKNLSFLWRHAWLARLLKFKPYEWETVLKLLQQDIVRPTGPGTSVPAFATPKAAFDFIELTDHLRNTGFTIDQLNWLLAADRSAKAALKEVDAARFLQTLRSDVQAIRRQFDPRQYEFLDPPSDMERLQGLLIGLLQQLHRNEAEAQRFIETIRDEVVQEIIVEGLPAAFTFPATITGPPNDIRISYEPVLRFAGTMTPSQRNTLLTDASLAAVTGSASYLQAIQDLFDTPGASAAVAGLPAGFAFPAVITGAPNNIPISYEPIVRFTGLMTTAQQVTLLSDASLAAVTGIAAYQEAVEEFFQAPRLAIKFLDPVFTAPLATLPASVDFATLADPALAQRISYDPERRLLNIIGRIAPTEKAALDALSADVEYQNAVNSLFTQPTLGVFNAEQLWLQDTDLVFPLRDPNRDPDDPGNEDIANLKANLATAVKKALPHLSRTQSELLVVQRATGQLGLTEALTRGLLSDYAVLPDTLLKHLTQDFADTIGVVDYATSKPTFDGWFWATRVAALWLQWKLTFAEWRHIREIAASPALLADFDALPLDSANKPPIAEVLRISRLLWLRSRLPETDITLLEILEKLDDGDYPSASDFAADIERLNENWTKANAEALVGAIDLAFPNDYLLTESWERVRRAFQYVDSLGAEVSTIKGFAAPAMAASDAQTLRSVLRAKFGNDTWLTLSTEIQDALRERKRDALAAYLLTQPKPADAPSGKWDNTNDLYAYYLLDVEMGACQLTSRLVQGSGSIQLGVQRFFMGLEPDVRVEADGPNGDTAWRWWKWMRKYRVWEANWKVWLWPENWILPELKRDRSSFFKDLEKELLQSEINQDSVETAFANYLEKLDGVAQLEVAGFYQEDDGENAILHVFGRTTGTEPHLYYYRRYDYRQWTPWERVDLDISGDYLIPAVVNRRLFLFWPIFTEVPDESSNETVDVPDMIGGSKLKAANSSGDQVIEGSGPTSAEVKNATKKLRVQMAVSDYRQGKWSPKRISKDFDESQPYTSEIVRRHYQFFPVDGSEGRFGVSYEGYSADSAGTEQAYLFGAFDIAGCEGVPVLDHDMWQSFRHGIRPEADSTGEYTNFLKWLELVTRSDGNNDLTFENALATNIDSLLRTPVLIQTPWLFKISPPWHLSYLDRFWLNVPPQLLYQYTGDRMSVPIGSWLPFFYADKKRTFFVLPSVAGRTSDRVTGSQSTRQYYPEIKREFRKWEASFEGLFQGWAEGLDLTKLTPAQRAALEQFLANQVPGETSPPFTDDEVRYRLVRFFMIFVHYYLGLYSWWLFQFRQFHFLNFYHPFVCEFAKLVHNPLQGIPGLMRREVQFQDKGLSFLHSYQPTPWVVNPGTEAFYPKELVDFSPAGAYASYNWEIFFHAPLLIANALSRNQRFEEARNWYHFIFNPIGTESAIPGGSPLSKYWITKPFYETTDPTYVQQRIENIMHMLVGDTSVPGYSVAAQNALEEQIRDWRANPFEPHRIANYRTVAYQKTVVMNYLDNLISWGDYLFRQDSMESINEATQLYILAAEILGPRPKRIPLKEKPPVETFNELEHELDAVPNALVEVENFVPPVSGSETEVADGPPLPVLYFCIPHNEKMLGYWDTVADRLYKIRHCMNIEGVVRQLALFEPPIDPGALVKAVAGGVDIGTALAALNAPLPLYRFSTLLQKANEVCNDVKALGTALLGALEKKDSEGLGLLRQEQEIRVLNAVTNVREQQIGEAKENLDALKKNIELVRIRRDYYRDVERIIASEQLSLQEQAFAQRQQEKAQNITIAASVLGYLPNITVGASGFGGSPHVNVQWGTGNIISALQAASASESLIGSQAAYRANKASTLAGYDRRFSDWKLQESLANKELEQLERSIAAAELRLSIAEKERDNHLAQIENSKEIDRYLRSKYTNEELYQWQVGQISSVFFQTYKLAFDLSKRAESCFRFELGLADSSFIAFGYWDSLKKGLLAGEKLQYDLRRLETAYIEQNRREFELTKHVSLALLDPLALIKLRETGRCFFSLPEELFDLDYPGHYFRRVKSISLTLPSVAGPYTTVSCTLRLLKNSTRVTTASGDNGYPRNTNDSGEPADDTRFVESNIPVRAIATSSAQNDSGVFELSFRDERYLPFEGAGAISDWSLELFTDLPANNPDPTNPDFGSPLRQFDYGTIADAVLHIKYSAREDAGAFKNGAIAHLREFFTDEEASSGRLGLDLRRDFGTAWSRFLNPADPSKGNVFELEVSQTLFPYRDAGKTLQINSLQLLARCTDAGTYNATVTLPPAAPKALAMARSETFGGLHSGNADVSGVEIAPNSAATWQIKLTRPGGGNLTADPVSKSPEISELFLVLSYEWVD